ncbi:MAG: OmpA family protein [Flavobacteriales bacterium]|nr:OmpA family protein [Flavobacteriales bacterium]
MAVLAYADAQSFYERVLAHGPDRHASLGAAEAARKQNLLDAAATHYQEAEALEPLAGDAAYQYGRLLMGLGDFLNAEQLLVRSVPDLPERKVAVDLIGSCQGYRSFYSDSSRYAVSPLLLPGLATAFSPAPYRTGLMFTAATPANGNDLDPWNGLAFLDLYFAALLPGGDLGKWTPVQGTVNGPYHEGPAAISPDGRSLWFTRSNSNGTKLVKDQLHISNLNLYRAQLQANGDWDEAQPFAYNNDSYSVGQPALSPDGKTLYFTSDMPGGLGGKDLWRSRNNGIGWEPPVNMGPTINTAGDEMFPTTVGNSLYFSSTGHTNMGGLDIFETHLEGPWWSEPQNMGYPVNTTRDDLGLWLDSTSTSGYFSSSRSGTDQLYSLKVQPPLFFAEGKVTNARTGEPLPGVLLTMHDLDKGTDTTFTSGADGRFHIAMAPNTDHRLMADREGMLSQSRPLSTKGLGLSTTVQANIQMEPIPMAQPIIVADIFYDYDKWDIRPDAAVELDKVAVIFTDNPKFYFELGSHTDSRGGDTYNLVLSDARAKSAVDYLVRHGVDPDHITAKGYGETIPVNGCVNNVPCTEVQHQANRRTEFKVVEKRDMLPSLY